MLSLAQELPCSPRGSRLNAEQRRLQTALAVLLIDRGLFFVGSEKEAAQGTYGATTLRAEHVTWTASSRVRIQFSGRAGRTWDREVHLSKSEASHLRALMRGKQGDERILDVTDRHVRAWFKGSGERPRTTLELREWHGYRCLRLALEEVDRARGQNRLTPDEVHNLVYGLNLDRQDIAGQRLARIGARVWRRCVRTARLGFTVPDCYLSHDWGHDRRMSGAIPFTACALNISLKNCREGFSLVLREWSEENPEIALPDALGQEQ